MGLSSSQARLLSLTGRMHNIEYKAQKLEAQKLQIANESTQVYKEYENALNQTKIQFKQMAADGSIDYVDATYNILMGNNYKLSASGKLVVSQADINDFNSASIGGSDPMQFACIKSGFCKVNNASKVVLTSDESKVCIFTADQLKTNASSTDTKVLMNDITVNEQITTLNGTLDGNGHTITVTGTEGLFNTLNNATVENLNLKGDINVTTSNNGLLASSSLGTTTIKNINLSGNITSSSTSVSNIGGLIGYNNSGTLNINDVSSNVNITYSGATANNIAIGGIVGQSGTGKIEISNSIYNGDITSNNSTKTHAGGILGLVATSNSGTVTINDCQTSGSISATNNSNPTSTGCGGIIGSVWSTSDTSRPKQNVINCISSMDINGGNSCAGGIVGYCQTNTTNCSSSGTIAATNSGEIYGGGSYVDFSHNNDNPQCNATGATTSNTYDPTTSPNFQHYYEIGKAIQSEEYVLVDGYEDDSNWLTNMINNAFIILAKLNPSTGSYDEVNVATDTSLQEVTDEVDLKKAEAKYEADMRKINQKDKKFDTELAAMEAERNAIKTEIETLKSVAKDNVDRTYKLFG